jgi:hypothetical protein
MTPHAHPHDGAAQGDSSGVPWHDRVLSASGFETDRGAAAPALIAALVAWAKTPSADTERAGMAALAGSRWLVPVVAAPGETGTSRGSLQVDQSAEMATVTITAPDGRTALPVFTGVAQLAEWDPLARPVPVPASRAAQAAVAEGCEVLLVDLGSAHAVALRPSMVWALAMAQPWLPAHEDAHVLAAIMAAVRDEPDVLDHTCSAGAPAGEGVLRIGLALRPGLTAAAVGDLATRIGERIATDGEARARIDALSFAIKAAP